jgi:hypothetical protein
LTDPRTTDRAAGVLEGIIQMPTRAHAAKKEKSGDAWVAAARHQLRRTTASPPRKTVPATSVARTGFTPAREIATQKQ